MGRTEIVAEDSVPDVEELPLGEIGLVEEIFNSFS